MKQQAKLYIYDDIINNLPAMVKNELAKMPAKKQSFFLEEFKLKVKSTGLAYTFLLIILAAHYAYLKKWGLQILFWFTAGGLGIWFIVDLFRLPGLVKDYNKDVAVDIIRNMKLMS